MRFLLAILLLPTVAWGASYTAASLSYSDMVARLASCADGDTLNRLRCYFSEGFE